MLYREINAVFLRSTMKHSITPCGQNVELFERSVLWSVSNSQAQNISIRRVQATITRTVASRSLTHHTTSPSSVMFAPETYPDSKPSILKPPSRDDEYVPAVLPYFTSKINTNRGSNIHQIPYMASDQAMTRNHIPTTDLRWTGALTKHADWCHNTHRRHL
jgi:hypothetical protein